MDAEWIIALATTGAAALVSAVATDAWTVARSGIARLFGRGSADRDKAAEAWMDRTAVALTQAGTSEREEVFRTQVAVWAARLSDLLEEYPELRQDVERLTGEVRAQLPAARQQRVQAIATGAVTQISGGGANVANTGVVMGDIHVESPRP